MRALALLLAALVALLTARALYALVFDVRGLLPW
jgi:hypothetical protein